MSVKDRPSPLDVAAPEIRKELNSKSDSWWGMTRKRMNRRKRLKDVLLILERQNERYGS